MYLKTRFYRIIESIIKKFLIFGNNSRNSNLLRTIRSAIYNTSEKRSILFSNNEKLSNTIHELGEITGDLVWRMPLDENYGKTINEIESCKIRVNGIFRYETNRYSRGSLIESLSNAHLSIRKIFQKNNFDFVCILGDRFEKLAIVNNAIIFNKPIIHLFGGEKSEGVIDEQIRHMITKASHLHFVMSEVYKKI